MPFCVQCGGQVAPDDAFCHVCGSRQGEGKSEGARKAGKGRGDLQGLNPKTASILCYAPWFGWIMAIVVLASQRFRSDFQTRFHAFQGLYLFAAHFLAKMFLPPMLDFNPGARFMSSAVSLALLGIGIFMMVKTAHGEMFRLPLLGDLAEKSVAEQK